MYSLKRSKSLAIVMRIFKTLILNGLPASWRFMIGRSTMSVQVDLPLDLEVVIPLEIRAVLQLRLLNLGFPTL
jgi:hypothetical protein